MSDAAVTRFLHFAVWDEGRRREWFTSVIQRASHPHRDAYDWAITLRGNGRLIGWLILGRSRHATEEGMRECGCGYALNQHSWGQGYMPEALWAVFPSAFTVLGTQRIHAECERGHHVGFCVPVELSKKGDVR